MYEYEYEYEYEQEGRRGWEQEVGLASDMVHPTLFRFSIHLRFDLVEAIDDTCAQPSTIAVMLSVYTVPPIFLAPANATGFQSTDDIEDHRLVLHDDPTDWRYWEFLPW